MSDNVDDFLAHYGVKGMKWGVRRSEAQLEKAANRRRLKELDKAERAKDREAAANSKAKGDQRIIEARKNLPDKARQAWEAEKQYKIDKQEIGKVAARKIRNKAVNDLFNEIEVARQSTSEEIVKQIMADFGMGLIRDR